MKPYPATCHSELCKSKKMNSVYNIVRIPCSVKETQTQTKAKNKKAQESVKQDSQQAINQIVHFNVFCLYFSLRNMGMLGISTRVSGTILCVQIDFSANTLFTGLMIKLNIILNSSQRTLNSLVTIVKACLSEFPCSSKEISKKKTTKKANN